MIANFDSLLKKFFVLKLTLFPIESWITGLAVDGYYERSTSCGGLRTLLIHSCASPIVEGKGEVSLSCLLHCSKSPSCLGIAFEVGLSQIKCYQIQACNYDWDKINCDLSLDKRASIFKRVCLNNGKLVNRNGLMCQCNDGWIGNFCERRAKHCKELLQYKYTKKPITVHINYKSKLMKMRCHVNVNQYQIGLFANNGTTNKSRSWNDYKHGFYDDDANYFLGLENIRGLIQDESSSLNTYVRQIYQIKGNRENLFGIYRYYGFVLDDESKGYAYSYDKVEIEKSESSTEKCFENKDGGIPFSTPDNDNDRDADRNCAALSQVGWWFDTCAEPITCNPLGWRAQLLPLPLTHARFTLGGVNVNSDQFKTKWLRMDFKLMVKT